MNIKYSALYDAYYDADTGEWTEPVCGDDDCYFCLNRPDTAPVEAEEPETPPPWHKFNRMHGDETFFGCVDKDGFWFDSSTNYVAAVHWCCMNAGAQDFETIEQEAEWMRTEGAKLGYSIIHSDMLRKMYEAGLIK